jgi:hypothetical protein
MPDAKDWLAVRMETDRCLYERYGKPLEASHRAAVMRNGLYCAH